MGEPVRYDHRGTLKYTDNPLYSFSNTIDENGNLKQIESTGNFDPKQIFWIDIKLKILQ